MSRDGAQGTKSRLVPSTVKQTGQESGCQLIPQFRISIVFVVKVCKQCLQTASASVGLRPYCPRASPLDPTGGLPPLTHWAAASQMKNS